MPNYEKYGKKYACDYKQKKYSDYKPKKSCLQKYKYESEDYSYESYEKHSESELGELCSYKHSESYKPSHSCKHSESSKHSHSCKPVVFSGYANPYSTLPAPSAANVNEYFPLTDIDTKDWTIDPTDNTVLILNNPGVWQVTLQYQLVAINATTDAADSTIDGWFNLNGQDVPASDATQYVSRVNGRNVLVIALSADLKRGDRVRIGIRSSSLSDVLNVQCQSAIAKSGILAPSIIITAIKSHKH